MADTVVADEPRDLKLDLPLYSKAETVYEPAEDTFLLIDGMEKDLANILLMRPRRCVEVGCGNGVPITSLANFLKESCYYCAIDINPDAVKCTGETFSLNGMEAECIRGDLLQPLLDNGTTTDILIFNPPYVVTESNEVGGDGMSAAWAGGKHGREVIDRFLPQVPHVLEEHGVLYMIALDENLIDGSLGSLLDLLPGFLGETLLTRRVRNELLHVLKFYRPQHLKAIGKELPAEPKDEDKAENNLEVQQPDESASNREATSSTAAGDADDDDDAVAVDDDDDDGDATAQDALGHLSLDAAASETQGDLS